MPPFKKIILCADDFGLNPAISNSLIQLVAMQRLSAVSCMVNRPDFSLSAQSLLPYKDKVQCGLHFNLTEGVLLSDSNHLGFSLKGLLLKTHLRLLKSSFFKKELNAQLDSYVEIMGELPRFIDGHQHVHQFPQVRQALLEVYDERLKRQDIYIRSTSPAIILPQYKLKSQIVDITGGDALAYQLSQRAIPHNAAFAGVYDFRAETDYRRLFCSWLDKAPRGTLIMCHPARESASDDRIAPARAAEFAYFSSDTFVTDCLSYKVIL